MARKKKSPPKPFYNKELAKMFDASDAAAYKSSALQPFKKFLTAGQVGGRQRAVVLSEPRQQVIVFNSLHVFFPSSPDQV